MEYATLSNGIKMPMLGYGVYQIPEADTERCVLDAISCGYRSIDTAQAYHNEEGVGNAIEKSGVPREELFITTKIWIANAGYEKAKASIAESLRKLKTSYIDLLLIHQPFSDYYGTWRAMEEAYKNGQLRAIGVANFYPDRLIDLCQFAEGRNGFFTNGVLNEVAAKYNKSAAQVALRFLIQCGVVVIPKSVHKDRMVQNFDIFDFKLSDDDMAKIRALDTGRSLFFSHYDPATVESLTNMGKHA